MMSENPNVRTTKPPLCARSRSPSSTRSDMQIAHWCARDLHVFGKLNFKKAGAAGNIAAEYPLAQVDHGT
jgi:hypothetical protein